MHENLIILGAGATAAISEGGLPIASNFFCSTNRYWDDHRSDYPHLVLACKKVAILKSQNISFASLTLTDVWLFIDTLLKYHSATRCNNAYNAMLLRKRYLAFAEGLPYYLSPEYLNENYNEVCSGFSPLFSTLEKQIYHTVPQTDIIPYFLILAGWELKHLLYKTYYPSNSLINNSLYENLIDELKDASTSVLNLNYDIFFEKACMAKGQKLQLANEDKNTDKDTIYLCKPHGGWNIKHIDHYIEPCCRLDDHIEDASFDRGMSLEIRPAMIPYFESPDEIKAEHLSVYPGVGKYFFDQQERMKEMFKTVKNVVSVGYSFSEADLHVREIIKKLDKKGEKNLLCILKGADPKEDIKNLWGFDNRAEENGQFQYHDCGFDEKSIRKIIKFL